MLDNQKIRDELKAYIESDEFKKDDQPSQLNKVGAVLQKHCDIPMQNMNFECGYDPHSNKFRVTFHVPMVFMCQ